MEKLQKLYSESDVTLTELSKITGFSVSTVSRYVNGKVKFSNVNYINSITKALEKLHQTNTNNITNKEVINVNTDVLKEQMMGNRIRENKVYDNTTSDYSSSQSYQSQRIPHKGEIWYVKGTHTVGREMWSGSQNRPCVVIQNTKLGNIGTFLCVYLTKQPKEAENPTFVTIQTNVVSTAICSQVNAISKDRFVNCVGTVTEIEMSLIERAILTACDIKVNPKSDVQHLPDYISIKTELMVYKQLYQDYIKIQSIQSVK